MPGFNPFRLFVFSMDHVLGDVNDTNVCKYNANVKLSEWISVGKGSGGWGGERVYDWEISLFAL